MISRTSSLVLQGMTPIKIEIEVNGHQGVPGLILIGLPAKAVDEAKERITSSLHACHIRIRGKRTVVNLAPADLRKTSSALDLAIAIGLLTMYGEISPPSSTTAFLGELALDGQLKPLLNSVALIVGAQRLGMKRIIIPTATRLPPIPFSDIEIIQVESLAQYLTWHKMLLKLPSRLLPSPPKQKAPTYVFETVVGQAAAKRALQIAAAGGHHLLLTGPPGVGKTLLAQALHTLMPPLTPEERLEVLAIKSLYQEEDIGAWERPFRSPHHSLTVSGLVGGTAQFRPGEISLAHRGVLCLDELPEFNQRVLESLRQPLEQKSITITNGHGSATFPCDFQLVATANPCPCGFSGSTTKVCRCSIDSKIRYQQKLSGPLIDRIDLQLSVDPWVQEAIQPSTQPRFDEIRAQISTCRKLQGTRYQPLGYHLVSQLPGHLLEQTLSLTSAAQHLAKTASQKLLLSHRAYTKMLRVAQTIADLETSEIINEDHLAEALQYRKPDQLQ